MVRAFVNRGIPQQARLAMESKALQEREFSRGELERAWMESKEIEDVGSRRKVQEKLRQEILSQTYGGAKLKGRNNRG
jgi:hypothetical protein